jgi:hypothetical protein
MLQGSPMPREEGGTPVKAPPQSRAAGGWTLPLHPGGTHRLGRGGVTCSEPTHSLVCKAGLYGVHAAIVTGHTRPSVARAQQRKKSTGRWRADRRPIDRPAVQATPRCRSEATGRRTRSLSRPTRPHRHVVACLSYEAAGEERTRVGSSLQGVPSLCAGIYFPIITDTARYIMQTIESHGLSMV